MGLIVDGTISGTLPDQMAFAVNYPGYPSSVDRAIETLGGEEGLAKARSSEFNFLELKFRPQDPYAHPAFGELSHSSDLVLRLSRKTKRNASRRDKDESTSITAWEGAEVQADKALESGEELRAEIVAKVEHTYAFEGMTDYQYVVAIHADDNRGHKRRGHQQDKGSLLDMEQGELMMLVPPLFSVKDLPEDIFLRPPGGKKPKQGLIDVEVSPEIVVPFALDFKIKEVPSTTTWKRQLDRNSDAYARTEALVNMFEERPIWAKSTLNERLMEQEVFVTDAYLRSLLLRISYYFSCGPFRNLWIRNGYDPRKDPESRKYQALDFRVPAVLRVLPGMPKDPPKWKDLCSFKSVPQKKFTIFQMFDLQDDVIQAETNKPPERATCGESTGWYRLSTIQRMRLVVRIRFLALYPGEVARSLENAERKSLNRPKSAVRIEEEPTKSIMDIPDRISSVEVGDGAGDPSREPLPPDTLAIGDHVDDTGENEPAPKTIVEEEEEEDEDEEEDEEELEDDEDEEELEEGDLQSESDIGKLGLQGCMDPADIIPKNYLQALLGKFSFEGDGAEHPIKDTSAARDDDEEYPIYEQDEDDEDE